jgi:hypothetical protein
MIENSIRNQSEVLYPSEQLEERGEECLNKDRMDSRCLQRFVEWILESNQFAPIVWSNPIQPGHHLHFAASVALIFNLRFL